MVDLFTCLTEHNLIVVVQFKDLTSLPCLFNLYTVICSVNNPSGPQSTDTANVQRLILDAILTYTQPELTSGQREEGGSSTAVVCRMPLRNPVWHLQMKQL